MRVWKKSVAALLCVLLVLTMLPMSVFAVSRGAAPAAEVTYNLLDMEVTVGCDETRADGSEPYVLFEEDGSYTIELEDDAFFPYEVQFTCDGVTLTQWFETPESSVEIGGHVFYVQSLASGAPALTQFGVWVGDDYIPAYPAAKEFTTTPQTAPMSLLPLEEDSYTLDLSGYLRAEVRSVKLSALVKNGSIQDTDTVVWADARGNGNFTIADGETTIDLLEDNEYASSVSLELIVGKADQLDTTNVRHRVYINLPQNENLFQVTAANEDRTAMTVRDLDTWPTWDENDNRTMVLHVSVDPEKWSSKAYTSLSFADSSRLEDLTVAVYEGLFDTEEAAKEAGAKDITANIWKQDLTTDGYLGDYSNYSSRPRITIVIKRDGNVVDVEQFILWLAPDYASCYFYGIYMDNGSESRSRINDYDYDYPREYTFYTYYLNNETDINKTYYVSMRAYNDSNTGIYGKELVEKAVVGEFDSLKEAEKETDIKEQLFSDASKDGGYATRLDSGVVFTVFFEDGTIDKLGVKVAVGAASTTVPSAPTPLSADTYFRMERAYLAGEEGNTSLNYYVMPYEHDSYYYNGYQTVFVLNKDNSAVTAKEIIPSFYTGNKVNVYAGHDGQSGTKQESGKTAVAFESGKAIQYSAAAENGTHLKNYWVTFVTKQEGASLFVNGATNSQHLDEETGLPIREVLLDDAHGNVHDIFFANIGDTELTGLYVKLEDAKNVQLDPYWTIGETTTLAAFTDTIGKEYGENGSYRSSYGELRNVGKIRLIPTEAKGDISGTLVIGSTNGGEVKIKLTGNSGIPEITTSSIVPGVKYVPYSSVIQTNSMGKADSVVFQITEGQLPQGVILKPNGEIYGVPQVTGEFTFTVQMTYTTSDGDKYTDSAEYTLIIVENTNENVWEATDSGYDVTIPVGELDTTAAEPYTYVLDTYADHVFKSNGKFSYFIDFWLDGKRLTEGVDYHAEEGSTKITIYEQTFRNAGSGSHTIAAEFREGGTEDGVLKRAAQNYIMEGSSFTPGNGFGSSTGSNGSGSSTSSSGNGTPFADVPAGAWFYADVKWAYDNQWMIGVSNTEFAPNSAVSQATIVTVLARMADVDLGRFSENPYPSIPDGKWYTNAAVWAMQTGILPTKTFGGEEPIGRGDMAIMLVNYMKHLGMDLKAPTTLAEFADADQMTEKQADAFQILYRYGIFKGMGERRMEPGSSTTRAQFAALINRIDSMINS